MNPFKRRHIRDVAMHIDIETRNLIRANCPKELTNDDQRLLYLLARVKK